MPSSPASQRRGSRDFVTALDTGNAPDELLVPEVPIEDPFGVRQCFGCVHVLPLSVADFQGTKAPLGGQLPHAIGERTVSIPGCRFEAVKQGWAAHEHAGVQGIVVWDLFADIHDAVPVTANFGGVVEVKNA